MSSEEEFLLKWNNHQNNLIDVFKEWLKDELFVDVTLVCDGEAVSGHKMVLAACSPLLSRIFHDNPCKHPVLILNNVPSSDMKALISFIYGGEVNVPQSELPSFLRTAENLQIKGLAEDKERDDRKRKDKESHTSNGSSRKRSKNDAVEMHSVNNTISNSMNHKRKSLNQDRFINEQSFDTENIVLPTISNTTPIFNNMHHTSQKSELSEQDKEELRVKSEPLDFASEVVWQDTSSTLNRNFSSHNSFVSPPGGFHNQAGSPLGVLNSVLDSVTSKYINTSGNIETGDENRNDLNSKLSLHMKNEVNQNTLPVIFEEVLEEDVLSATSPSKFRGGRKPCCFCGKTFCDTYTLRRHMVTHISRERQFECNLCPAAYSRKDHLMAHIRRKHNATSFEMDIGRSKVSDYNH